MMRLREVHSVTKNRYIEDDDYTKYRYFFFINRETSRIGSAIFHESVAL